MGKKGIKFPPRIWDDKNINPEGKIIYSIIYSKGFDKTITHINIGEIQHTIKIKNVGFKKHLELLEKYKYLIYREYSKGMYMVSLLN